MTCKLCDRYDKVVIVGGLSKAFGLPGLRVGWLIAPPQVLQAAKRRHEYTTITTGVLSMMLAERALQVRLLHMLQQRCMACFPDWDGAETHVNAVTMHNVTVQCEASTPKTNC